MPIVLGIPFLLSESTNTMSAVLGLLYTVRGLYVYCTRSICTGPLATSLDLLYRVYYVSVFGSATSTVLDLLCRAFGTYVYCTGPTCLLYWVYYGYCTGTTLSTVLGLICLLSWGYRSTVRSLTCLRY